MPPTLRSKTNFRRKHRAARARYEKRQASFVPAEPALPFPEYAQAEINHEEQLANALDCYFCGLRADARYPPEEGGFNNWQRLADHTFYCPWSPLPKPRTELHLEGARILAANRVADERMKGRNMDAYLPPAPSKQAGGSGSTLPPFLKAKDMKKGKPVVCTIVDVRKMGNSRFDKNRKQFGLDVKIGKTVHTVTMNADSPNHRILAETLGKKWIGKKITLERISTSYGNDTIAVQDPRG